MYADIYFSISSFLANLHSKLGTKVSLVNTAYRSSLDGTIKKLTGKKIHSSVMHTLAKSRLVRTARSSWKDKRANLNMDRDGKKLWTFFYIY